MWINRFEEQLTGGHQNSLGNTVEVVDSILANKNLVDDLYRCYFSQNEVVRLRVSNAMKRICIVHPDWIAEYLDKLITEISKINQASTQWTLAQIFLRLQDKMTETQKNKATEILKSNLESSSDWIVQNHTIETLSVWAELDGDLRKWLVPRLQKFEKSKRKSVAGRARKKLKILQSV